jgi:Pentapeptide repeats (8 copies)
MGEGGWRGNILDVPDRDNRLESGQVSAESPAPHGVRQGWWSSPWIWPAVAIGLVSTAGTSFGPIGAILAGEGVAVFAVTAWILFASRERWLTFGMALALAASVLISVGSIWLHQAHDRVRRRAAVVAARDDPGSPVDWSWRRISEAMVRDANLRGAYLDDANLNGLQLSYRDLDGVQADGASFRGAQLEHASLRGASLRGACLEGADLAGADLAGADFSGADVAGVTVSVQAEKAALAWPTTQSLPAVTCL